MNLCEHCIFFIQFAQPFSSSGLSIWFAYSYCRGTWRVRIRKAVLPPLADSPDMTSIPSCQLIKRNKMLLSPTGHLIRLPLCGLRKLQAYQKDTHSRFNRFIPARQRVKVESEDPSSQPESNALRDTLCIHPSAGTCIRYYKGLRPSLAKPPGDHDVQLCSSRHHALSVQHPRTLRVRTQRARWYHTRRLHRDWQYLRSQLQRLAYRVAHERQGWLP